MKSTYDFLKQEATSHLKSIGNIINHLQHVYEETGDEHAKLALDSLRGSFQTYAFIGSPATRKNHIHADAKTFVGSPSSDVSFADRVKTIVNKAATKNGELIESNARGHARAYPFYIDANVFGKGVDKMLSVHEREFKEYLGGTLMNVQVTKVCHFIGHVVRMRVVNDSKLQLSDLTFAFEPYYNPVTVKKKLSVKELSYQEKDFFNFFESLLKGVKKQLEAKK